MNDKAINNESGFVTKNDHIFEINGLWKAPLISQPDTIPKGDMPGDKIKIGESHMTKAQVIFPSLLEKTVTILNNNPKNKIVISVHGGSGVGKSEIGALLSYYFNDIGIGSYVLSGDNYPRRIPLYNDAERLRIYRTEALKGLVEEDLYEPNRQVILDELCWSDQDASVVMTKEYPWLKTYQQAGQVALSNYLGSESETDFQLINNILTKFKNGQDTIMLKRMGRKINELWYEEIDFSVINILIIEWTHGNNKHLKGVDIPILLNSTPEETLEHRRLRNRDGGLDSPFTSTILAIEQKLLHEQASNAKMIISKSGEIITYELYKKRMNIQ